jgi:PAS domain S-box-containing protein
LHKHKYIYRLLFKNSLNGAGLAKTGGEIIDCNRVFSKMLGYTIKEIKKLNITDFYQTKEEWLQILNLLKQKRSVKNYETVWKHKGGKLIDVIINISVIHLSGESLVQLTCLDITHRKKTEKALKISEQKYRTMLNASPYGIYITNLKGIIQDVSEIGLELFGSDNKNDLIGKQFFRFIFADDKSKIREIIKKTMDEGLVQNVEIKLRKKNSKLFLSEISITLIQDHSGAPFSFMIIVCDISRRKQLERRQIHADRMVSLGEMAAGIAHEINQPLNIISIVLDNVLFETFKAECKNKEYLKEKSDRIFENIDRINYIIDHVRSFSRNQDDYILTGFNVNDSIRNALSMISEQLKFRGIDLQINLGKNLPVIIGNTYKFEQVILNMLSNAKDTLLEKKTSQADNFKMIIEITSYSENHSVIVEIADNGMGIRNDDIEDIMLPFFSNKDAGKGTGLGLSISYQIIKEMNGNIEVKSKLLEGTTFKIKIDTVRNTNT